VLDAAYTFEGSAEASNLLAGARADVPALLSECLRGVTGQAELAAEPRAFLKGGLAAVGRLRSADGWVQLGLAPPADQRPACYQELGRLASDLLAAGTVSNFFFMHKPPGLRIRFEAASATAAELRELLTAATGDWCRRRLINTVQHAVYEPETELFGGPISMDCVHRLFTADSLAWLDAHVSGRPAWQYSLGRIRVLFDGLDIVGWEDIGVWRRLRDRAGRTLPSSATEMPGYAEAAEGVRQAWAAARTASAIELPEAWAAAAREWRRAYFETSDAAFGPRHGAALAIIFHWNRGALSSFRQGLLATALAAQESL
jgi:thiopeptide-type bacteriocin biosynthesis protein